MKGYAAAYALTLAVEPPVYAWGVRRIGFDARRGYLAGLLGNATSHPLTWLVLFPLLSERLADAVAFVAVEAFAIAWEAGLLCGWLRRERASLVAVACVANAVSLATGGLLLLR